MLDVAESMTNSGPAGSLWWVVCCWSVLWFSWISFDFALRVSTITLCFWLFANASAIVRPTLPVPPATATVTIVNSGPELLEEIVRVDSSSISSSSEFVSIP